jgi:hypothetical protein
MDRHQIGDGENYIRLSSSRRFTLFDTSVSTKSFKPSLQRKRCDLLSRFWEYYRDLALTQKNILSRIPIHKSEKAYCEGITGDFIQIKQLSLLNVKIRVWG